MIDMTWINPRIICNKLNVDPTYKPIKQNRRKLGPEHTAAVNAEIERFTNVGSITEFK